MSSSNHVFLLPSLFLCIHFHLRLPSDYPSPSLLTLLLSPFCPLSHPSIHLFLFSLSSPPLLYVHIPSSAARWWLTADVLSLTRWEGHCGVSEGQHVNINQTHFLFSADPKLSYLFASPACLYFHYHSLCLPALHLSVQPAESPRSLFSNPISLFQWGLYLPSRCRLGRRACVYRCTHIHNLSLHSVCVLVCVRARRSAGLDSAPDLLSDPLHPFLL